MGKGKARKTAGRVRADVLLVERGLAETRSQARSLIMAGDVVADDQRVEKAGDRLDPAAELRLKERRRFVSRGGDKLDHALRTFAPDGLDPTGAVVLDVGASTGGFTDCVLRAGASKVYAVDVGWGQLHPRLRGDDRVVVRERTNARHLSPDDFDDPIDLVVVDASFISLDKLLPAIAAVLPAGGELVALVKPQFEAGREAVTSGKGVIRDPALRERVIAEAVAHIADAGFRVKGGTDCPVAGPKGNVEHLVWAERRG